MNEERDQRDLLIRLESLVNQIIKELKDMKEGTAATLIKLENDKVDRAEFLPVRNIAFGLVTLILTGVIGALISIVIKAPK